MKRILVLVALSLFLCPTASGFQGGGGESTKKGSIKKKETTKKKGSGTTSDTTPPKGRVAQPSVSAKPVETKIRPPAPPTVQVFGPGLSIDLGNNVSLEFLRIPAGTFTMGSPSSEAERNDDEEQHQVTISHGFYMGKYEVTQAQWQAVMETTVAQQRDKSDPTLALYGEGGNYPMYYVNWDEAQEFIKRLNAMKNGFNYRLPTDAEWEYAARAGTTGPYAGSLEAMAWYSANSGGKSHPVGQKQANAWGLYDMHGNVIEWCQDWNGVSYTAAPAVDPSGPANGKLRVLRGGSWYANARNARSASRRLSTPDGRSLNRGFRVVAVVRTP
ncbi:MAG TPA: formylglycine-generating enzyme family protein [Pyrinomonadaceae bacterium]